MERFSFQQVEQDPARFLAAVRRGEEVVLEEEISKTVAHVVRVDDEYSRKVRAAFDAAARGHALITNPVTTEEVVSWIDEGRK